MAKRIKTKKMKDGELCYTLIIENIEYLVPVDDYKEALNLGISYDMIRKKSGVSTLKKYINKVEYEEGLGRIKREDRERSERKALREEEKKRKEYERLVMIEKAKCRGKWFEHLSENDIFPKVVK
ncbi:hypothetical protein [Staphylococcus casei]|uniref:Transposase n=1 Tax=Staphylococcus casei TaxID=201828 RepID=A0ABZ2WBW0_9STAP